jgi:hypothetical protein
MRAASCPRESLSLNELKDENMALLDAYTGTWAEPEASHLLRRAGFGGSKSDRQALAAMTLDDAVASLVDVAATDPYLDGPALGGGVFHGVPFADLPTTAPDDEGAVGASLSGTPDFDVDACGFSKRALRRPCD